MDSSAPNPRRRYDASKRLALAAETREAIVTAAERLLRSRGADQLTYPDTADAAGVSLRTIYRHFPTHPELLQAVAWRFLAEAMGPALKIGPTLDVAADQVVRMHQMLSEEPSRYQLFFALPLRSESRLDDRMRQWLAEHLKRLPPERHRVFLSLVELMFSPFAWRVLSTLGDLPPDQVTAACLAGFQVLADGLVAHPEWLDPAGARPPMFQPPAVAPAAPVALTTAAQAAHVPGDSP